MSNAPKAAEPAPVVEDCGLGYCLPCLAEYKMSGGRQTPFYAITLAPAASPVPGLNGQMTGVAMVPTPSCYKHLNISAAPQRTLLVANGNLS